MEIYHGIHQPDLGFGTSQNKEKIGCSEFREKMEKAKWPFSMEEFWKKTGDLGVMWDMVKQCHKQSPKSPFL